MGGYIVNFTVYTMAMIGLICFAVFVYKKITDGSMRPNKTRYMSIEESMSLSPRKTLHIVKAGNERFLIASDIDKTTLISKLECNTEIKNLERFREIPPIKEEEYKDIQRMPYEAPYQTATSPKQIIHLDDINPERRRKFGASRNLDTLYSNNNTNSKSNSPMREMAKRINEL